MLPVWRERMQVTVSNMETRIAARLQEDGIHYLTQEPISVSSADFYFPTSQPLAVFLDGPPHLAEHQRRKDEVLRTAIRQSGYRVLELAYAGGSEKILDSLYMSILDELGLER
jgi:very-short-patch-repair endonuclease